MWILEDELLGLLGFGLLAVVWTLLPFWGVNRFGAARTRLVTGAGIFLIGYLAAFTYLGYVK